MTILICILVYLVIAFFVYNKITKNLSDYKKWEKFYFAVIWILLIPLYSTHWIHNKL